MRGNLKLNVPLLRSRVPNLTMAAKLAGLRAATVSNLCTGKTSVERAEVRTIVTLAQLAGCGLDELIIQEEEIKMIETGIKVIDLFVPLIHEGTVGLVARLGSGQMSLVAELCHRMKRSGYTTVFWKPESEDSRLKCVIDEASVICNTFEEVKEYISSNQSGRDLVLIADRSVVISGELNKLNKLIEELQEGKITTILVDIIGNTIDEVVPYGPLDTLMKFDVTLAKRGLYPSIDPIYSTSTLLEGDRVRNEHLNIQQRARKLLRRYRELNLLVNIQGEDILKGKDILTYKRGERLEAYLSQPQYVVEDVTGKPGTWVSLKDTLKDVKGILDGAYDSIELKKLLYIGKVMIDE
ncbi:ATP synthase beta subunit C-terminal domain-containing protein [Oceanirhabdus sp. W0125-5]|uniref:ATP synthase beta subunit C-terminal domain-containing protein n=1 Tax=Oceanirhabdus sp. W0125-5 TaxID=2999116 RepID=UPI0022F315D1|nr:hypothetical protein [Oceanirhabdus sp. W0125-5]WBW97157.1 hypothetical protein OW730_26230 [Oceanirhabdus sp. W0125-5]